MSTKPRKRVVAVVPARYGSTRSPGKVVAEILGKPMIQWVCQGARFAETLDEIWVATDDDRVESVCRQIDIPVFRNRKPHHSGSDRIIESCRLITADIVVNIQGDEPLISVGMIDAAVRPMLEDNYDCPVVTLIKKIHSVEELLDPNVVKVVVNHQGEALYFSRCPIPALFGDGVVLEPDPQDLPEKILYYKYIGLYVFDRIFWKYSPVWLHPDWNNGNGSNN